MKLIFAILNEKIIFISRFPSNRIASFRIHLGKADNLYEIGTGRHSLTRNPLGSR